MWFTEDAWSPIILCIVACVIFFIAWSTTRKSKLLIAIPLLLLGDARVKRHARDLRKLPYAKAGSRLTAILGQLATYSGAPVDPGTRWDWDRHLSWSPVPSRWAPGGLLGAPLPLTPFAHLHPHMAPPTLPLAPFEHMHPYMAAPMPAVSTPPSPPWATQRAGYGEVLGTFETYSGGNVFYEPSIQSGSVRPVRMQPLAGLAAGTGTRGTLTQTPGGVMYRASGSGQGSYTVPYSLPPSIGTPPNAFPPTMGLPGPSSFSPISMPSFGHSHMGFGPGASIRS